MRTKFVALTLLALLASGIPTSAVRADVEGPQINFTPHAGAAIWYDDVNLSEDILLGASLGLMTSAWFGFEGTVDFTPTHLAGNADASNKVTHLGASAILNLAPYRAVNPYLIGGWSNLYFDPAGVDGRNYNGWEAGMGLRFRVARGDGKQVNLRVDARNIMTKFDSGAFAVASAGERQDNLFITAGIEFSLGPAQRDIDEDGIADRNDLCTATPRRAIVDATGCAIDSDLDGVPDGIDLCDNSQGGALVDGRGCPLDSDEDGVADGIDRCESTVLGSIVDNFGCALDRDADGVADGVDRCPDTAAGISVDNFGCAVDTDGDGVVDGVDLCLATPAGVQVDANGCPQIETEQEREFLDTGLLRLDKVYFESGKAALKANSYAALDDVGRILSRWTQLRIELSGHTDSRGSEALNQRLSEERARSVFEYLASRFPEIKASQFEVVGRGESRSIATNDSAEGRTRNRRVEFQVMNRELLSR